MNKRVANDILKKYDDDSTRDDAVKLADEHGYALHVQIENGVSTLVGVSDEHALVRRGDLDEVDGVQEPFDAPEAQADPIPVTAPKKSSK